MKGKNDLEAMYDISYSKKVRCGVKQARLPTRIPRSTASFQKEN